MADKSAIEWTDATWNPTVGCSVVSPGCKHCYAMKLAARLAAMGQPIYQGLTQPSKAGAVWTGKVELSNWGQVIKPLSWKRPRRIFVNSMSDLFHESLPDEAIDKVFAVMALCPQHTFQVLTKRTERMKRYMTQAAQPNYWSHAVHAMGREWDAVFPLPNVWLGTSVEDQRRADERIPHLAETPAAYRFLSIEPLLGPVDLDRWLWSRTPCDPNDEPIFSGILDWVIVGGESGPGARPMHPDWVLSLRDQCQGADVSFFFKQWGNWGCLGQSKPGDQGMIVGNGKDDCRNMAMVNIGKKRTGRLLDGRTWDEFPA